MLLTTSYFPVSCGKNTFLLNPSDNRKAVEDCVTAPYNRLYRVQSRYQVNEHLVCYTVGQNSQKYISIDRGKRTAAIHIGC